MAEKENMTYQYIVEVRNGAGKSQKTYLYRTQLKEMRLSFTKEGKKWTGSFSCDDDGKKEETRIRSFCRHHGLKYTVKNTEYARDTVYRKIFFRNQKPVILKRYFCLYCGRLLKKDAVSVDHIIPIQRAETDRKIQKIIKMLGWKNINDIRNLGASCRSCNSKKGSRMGVWIIRGIIGSSVLFQMIRLIFRIGMIVGLMYMAVYVIRGY